MAKIAIGTGREATQPDCIQALIVEFICTFLFVFVGVGAAMATDKLAGDALVGLFFVAMAHALVVAVMICAGFRISGGHLNPAVTLGLCAGGHITVFRTILYWIDQCLASAAACALLNRLQYIHLLLAWATYKGASLMGWGPLLTGLVIGANIMVGGAFSGASMNPARSFGPALVSGIWTDHWVYWVGPLIGGGLAGLIYENCFIVRSHVPLPREAENF
ncbi:tonoplast intrinsic protein 4;1 [Actinidia rufa]|uniref:Tonoplast intrinsic protein 41 n=1 Tax=Actinidia rufa TaxID=165716 RepID=A0A7J0GCH9_9ERIC|nr:tonoplast intrinsic protein 4;1 [Actinidia rufa]